MDINFYVKSMRSFTILSVMWYKRLTQMLPITHWPVRVHGIGEDTPSNMLSFINFEPPKFYWTYFLALQITTPTIPPMRLMSLGHEPKKWDDVLWAWTMGFDTILSEYGLFWVLEEIFPKSMIMLTWCGSPMKWSHVVWKIYPQQYTTYYSWFLDIKANIKVHESIKKMKEITWREEREWVNRVVYIMLLGCM